MNEKIATLFRTIAGLNSAEECELLFEDLCTNKEVEQMAERAYAARMLMEGKTYSQIIAQADISSATLSRVSRSIRLPLHLMRFKRIYFWAKEAGSRGTAFARKRSSR